MKTGFRYQQAFPRIYRKTHPEKTISTREFAIFANRLKKLL
jgi:hypothetical protein